MICRHSEGDPSCTSGKAPQDLLRKGQSLINRWGGPNDDRYPSDSSPATISSPNPDDFEIERVEQVGSYLVVEAKYPSCQRCDFEGRKVMVFAGTTIKDAISWREIDPHFRPPGERHKKKAPGPIARFPATDEGWQDAMHYALSKNDRQAR